MNKRRSIIGWIVLLILIGLFTFAWSASKRANVEPGGGLLEMIGAVGDGIARRMGRG